MRIAICEDNTEHAEILKAMIQKWEIYDPNNDDVEVFVSAEQLLFNLSSGAPFDLAFLDVELASMNGLELAGAIREHDKMMILVFVTGYEKYVLEGYEVKALDYLLKPLSAQDVYTALTKAVREMLEVQRSAVIVPVDGGLQRVYQKSIIYVEIKDHYIVLHTVEGNIRFKQSLNEIEPLFPEPGFCKCHRAYIVNLLHLHKLDKTEVIMDNGEALGEKLPVSRTYRAALNKCFLCFYGNSMQARVEKE